MLSILALLGCGGGMGPQTDTFPPGVTVWRDLAGDAVYLDDGWWFVRPVTGQPCINQPFLSPQRDTAREAISECVRHDVGPVYVDVTHQ